MTPTLTTSLQIWPLRLDPGQDVRQSLEAITAQHHIKAALVLGAVGSLTQVCLRYAGETHPTQINHQHEILTLSGTVGNGRVHLHMSVADKTGRCVGGHLAIGCIVHTTLELSLGILTDISFEREYDPKTGFEELQIHPQSEANF